MTKKLEKKLEAVETKFLRKILESLYLDRVMIKKALEKADVDENCYKYISRGN